jgi:hypothetical protein
MMKEAEVPPKLGSYKSHTAYIPQDAILRHEILCKTTECERSTSDVIRVYLSLWFYSCIVHLASCLQYLFSGVFNSSVDKTTRVMNLYRSNVFLLVCTLCCLWERSADGGLQR